MTEERIPGIDDDATAAGISTTQATSVMSEGGMVADVIVAIASIDPVMGGVDR